jgi:molybdate transport system substrate-binding protein
MTMIPGTRLPKIIAGLAAWLMAGLAVVCATASARETRIAAAADLKSALDDIAVMFRNATGKSIVPVYGSSGNFKTQIIQGAPFEMFMSADEAFVFELAEKGLTLDRGTLYGFGRIVIYAPKGSPLRPDAALEDLAAGLRDGRVQRFAIANPEHAPYGRAAQEALTSKGLWEAIKPRLILGENVAQATQFAISGSSQGGIIALSLALTPAVSARGTYVLIPEDQHAPLAQRMVLLNSAGETAKAFYAFIQTAAAKSVLRRYGFRLPGEKD